MGRSRGGLTTKIHALVDAEGLPIALKLTEGQAHDGRSAQDMLGDLAEGQILLADRAYDSNALREGLAKRGAWGNIKPMSTRKAKPSFSPFSIATATSSSATSTNSNTSEPSRPATTSGPTTSSLVSNSLQPESGCALMSRSPRQGWGCPVLVDGFQAYGLGLVHGPFSLGFVGDW